MEVRCANGAGLGHQHEERAHREREQVGLGAFPPFSVIGVRPVLSIL